MPQAAFAYLADQKVHLSFDDGSEEAITSQFVDDVLRREASIERKSGWKNRGMGARFMGAAALWDDAHGRRSPAFFTALSRGRKRGEILYAISTGPVSGLFAYDVERKEETRLVHGTEGAPVALATSDDHGVIAMARGHKNGSCNIAVMREEGGDSALVTDGDTLDDAPAWLPVLPEAKEGRHQLVYQSTGIGRDPAGLVAGYAPTEINLLDAEHGNLTTILASESYDYLAPRMTLEGTLYAMRRPYQTGRTVDPATTLKDGVLAPFRLLYAGFRYLDFFTMRYTGKPLARSGNVKARHLDARKLIERQNIESAGETEDEASFRAPSDWVLVEKKPGGEERVVVENVVTYDLARDGTLYTSDGRGIDRRTPDGRSTRVSKTARVMAVTAT